MIGRSSFLLAALLLAGGCDLKLSKKRPKTAAEYCERLRKNFGEGAQTECAPVTDPGTLTLMQAVEAAAIRKKVDGKSVDIGFVTYTEGTSAKPPETIGGFLTTLGRQLAATGMLEASNEKARVSVWIIRGEISADGFEKVKADVTGLEPG